MRSLIIAFLSLFCGSIFCESSEQQPLMTDLIIILDEDTETNPSKGGACSLTITKALMAESTPFLVNASLWRVFLELQQEWLLRSQMLNTDIYNLTNYFAKIDDRINYWHSVLEGTGIDEVRLSALIADKINEEFFTKEKCKEWQETCKLPDNTGYFYIMALCARFITRCDFNAWYWFRLDTGYYLAVPKAYAARYTESIVQADILKACGFSSCGAYTVDPLHTDPIQTLELTSVEDTVIPMLERLFVPDGHFSWSLFVEGHGCCYKVDKLYRQRIVGVTVEKFKEMCQWFNANLSVHALWIKSCGAGGFRRDAAPASRESSASR